MTSSEFSTESKIKLDQFLKWLGVVQTGGEAKLLIQAGEVQVNGTIETRRGRKLVKGDRVVVMGETYTVQQ
ncbi:RNA-binding S4 domain-containing protein [Thermocoleostomius sinensis]|jgi:ribosome-associated protein|uniref:RNA-binding S4 domain-containing protein n=1 Tax=Thermocoleostomius sinensis A174 TaxID=2016057 RepID=A0A9E8ZCI9_9CYAN|nr:RNA-binding S4 domain-containing protein [Thermocoleostomius sinensis]WAL60351.1 RNA-binding S4 domain-containing protein [Thermocoleostomius sinensis A174]